MLVGSSAFGVGELGPETSLYGKGLGLNSVDVMALIVQIEEAFGIYFEDEEIVDSVGTFGTLVRAVRRKCAAAGTENAPDGA
jgi:acyl carrier protein